jgi:hypothetical protein
MSKPKTGRNLIPEVVRKTLFPLPSDFPLPKATMPLSIHGQKELSQKYPGSTQRID